MAERSVLCSTCYRSVRTMKTTIKKGGKYFCKHCGNDVTKEKIRQLLQLVKDSWTLKRT